MAQAVEEMSEGKIKAMVRTRDGNRCAECGATDEDFPNRTLTKLGAVKTKLEVHRIVPGTAYHPSYCVLLCKPCHDKKPRHALDIFCGQDPRVKVFLFNLYTLDDVQLWSAMEIEAEAEGVSVGKYIDNVLRNHVGLPVEDSLDYAI